MLRLGWVMLAIGCGAGSERGPLQDKSGGDDSLTFYADIAPLLVEKCGSCHRDDGSASFDVADYQSAVPWAEAMVDAIRDECAKQCAEKGTRKQAECLAKLTSVAELETCM